MKTIMSKLVIVLLSFLVALPTSAKMGKIAEGVAYSTKNALVRSVRKHKEGQDEFKRISIEIENQFSMGYLLSLVRYKCTTNSPTGYLPVGGSAFLDIWKYLPEKRRSELVENWSTAAQSLHDKVLERYATIQGKEPYYANRFTTFTNSYDKFLFDVASMSKREKKDSLWGLLHIHSDFRNMVNSGATIICKANLKTNDKPPNKGSLDIEMVVALGILGIWVAYLVIKKIREFTAKVSARKRFTLLIDKIDDYSVRNGFKKSTIERLGKEAYVRFQTNAQDNLTIAQDAKPNKDGFYLCSWALKDPKDDDFYYICPPTDYQILFNPNTGKTEIQRLKDSNSQ